MPGGREPDEELVEVDPTLRLLDEILEHDHAGHDERHDPEREQEEHRHEQELGRDGKP